MLFGPDDERPEDAARCEAHPLGALMAGGDNGKTELWNGFTWSTIEQRLTVYVPFARADCLPWEMHAGELLRPRPEYGASDADDRRGDEET